MCLNDANLPERFSSIPLVDCTQPHDSEVYAIVTLADGAYQAFSLAYMQRMQAHPAWLTWREAALAEPWIVPEDEAVVTSSNSGMPLAMTENSRAGQAYRDIASRLMGETVRILYLHVPTAWREADEIHPRGSAP